MHGIPATLVYTPADIVHSLRVYLWQATYIPYDTRHRHQPLTQTLTHTTHDYSSEASPVCSQSFLSVSRSLSPRAAAAARRRHRQAAVSACVSAMLLAPTCAAIARCLAPCPHATVKRHTEHPHAVSYSPLIHIPTATPIADRSPLAWLSRERPDAARQGVTVL